MNVANTLKDEASTLTGIKDSYFVDENGTKWDCIIINRDKPKTEYVPFRTPSQFLAAYRSQK